LSGRRFGSRLITVGKGWERASFEMNTRPDKIVRDISQADLFVPTVVDGGRLKLLALCAACGLMIAALYVWTTLLAVSILGLRLGRWFYPVVLASAAAISAGLYVFASWDFSRARRWARDA
jgi:hypothetical protein